MNLSDPQVKRVIDALQDKPILESELDLDEMFIEHCYEIADSIFSNDDRGRTLEQIQNSVVKGKQCEHAVATVLAGADISYNWNDNMSTYDWDIRAEGVKIEVKSQNFLDDKGKPKEFFSYTFGDKSNSHKKVQTLIQMWEHYDIVVAVKVQTLEEDGKEYDKLFIPWLAINNEAFSAARELFIPTKVENKPGMFLKMGKCESYGLLKYLS